jgi:hypothetical protein
MRRALSVFLSLLFWISLAHAQKTSVCSNPNVKVSGPAEVVFSYDHDKCSEIDTPDTPAMAFKDASGKVHLFNGIPGSYASIGTSLNNVRRDCSKPLSNETMPPSPQTPDSYDNWKWFRSPWTHDGQTIYGLIHNEFHGSDDKAYCPSGKIDPCLYPNVTVSKSTDGGKTFRAARDGNRNVVLGLVAPNTYVKGANKQAGIRAPTNVVSRVENGQTYYYVLANNRGGKGSAQEGATCLYRSDDVSKASHWRAWDGSGFTVVVNASPYREKNIDPRQHVCKPVFRPNASSWNYNTVLDQFIAVIGLQESETFSFGYITSKDMMQWSKPKAVMKTTYNEYLKARRGSKVSGQTYPSMIDPESQGLNFEYSGNHPYLYFTRMNPKMGNWHNRDLLRVPLVVSCGR